jgi:DNA-binding MarR family transcriptional regulator
MILGMSEARIDTEQRLLPLLDYLARVGRRAAEASMAPGGLRPRHLIALKLLRDQGLTSQHALAESLSLDPSNVVGLLNELEERRLITRRRDPEDRRRHFVEVSPLGEEELDLANARLKGVEEELLIALNPEERSKLYELLVRAVDAAVTCSFEMEPPTCPG